MSHSQLCPFNLYLSNNEKDIVVLRVSVNISIIFSQFSFLSAGLIRKKNFLEKPQLKNFMIEKKCLIHSLAHIQRYGKGQIKITHTVHLNIYLCNGYSN